MDVGVYCLPRIVCRFFRLPSSDRCCFFNFEAHSCKEETVGKSIQPLLNKVNFTHMEIKSV